MSEFYEIIFVKSDTPPQLPSEVDPAADIEMESRISLTMEEKVEDNYATPFA